MPGEHGVVYSVSVSHKNASVDVIEQVCTESQLNAARELHDHENVSEAFVLQTCNRAEAYVVVEDDKTANNVLADYLGDIPDQAVTTYNHDEALRHLLRVACGLESLVIGENEILGQLKTAYTDASSEGCTGPVLDTALLKAIHTGGDARDNTPINNRDASIGTAALDFINTRDDIEGRRLVIIGAGAVAGAILTENLTSFDDVGIVNRTVENADRLAGSVDQPVFTEHIDDFNTIVEPHDVIVTAVRSPEPVVTPESFDSTARPLTVVDLGQPRNVDSEVDEMDGVVVYTLDDLEQTTTSMSVDQKAAIFTVEDMVDEAYKQLILQYKRERADDAIRHMYAAAERIKTNELEKAMDLMGPHDELTLEEISILESFADSIVNQLLAAPTQSLRTAAENDDWETIHTALVLFNPHLDSTDEFDADAGESEDLPAAK